MIVVAHHAQNRFLAVVDSHRDNHSGWCAGLRDHYDASAFSSRHNLKLYTDIVSVEWGKREVLTEKSAVIPQTTATFGMCSFTSCRYIRF